MNSVKYQTGEVTWAKVAKSIGKITPPMAMTIFENAKTKISHMVTSDIEQEAIMHKNINKCRNLAANEYIRLFKEVNGDILLFIAALKKHKYTTNGDISIMSDREIEKMIQFKEHINDKDFYKSVKQYLIKDINKDDNIIELYQNLVSKLVFPNKKPGRQKLNK